MPSAGQYRIAHTVKGQSGATITLDADNTTISPMTAVSSTAWGVVSGPTFSLTQGLHKLHITSGGKGFHLDSFTLTRL